VSGRRRYLWFTALWALFTLPFLSRLFIGRTSNDVELFWIACSALLQGAAIYTDVVFEYPPYALIWFVVPAAMSGNLAEFRLAFGLLIWAIDAGVKGYLLWRASGPAGERATSFRSACTRWGLPPLDTSCCSATTSFPRPCRW
jgi:hypothetical protein